MTDERNVWIFFLVAFGFSWLFWIPKAMIARGYSFPAPLASFFMGPLNPAAFGPSIAGFSFAYLSGGWEALKTLVKRAADFRFGKVWYIPTLLIMPTIVGGGLLLAVLTGEPMPPSEAFSNPVSIPFAFIYILLLAGPVQEEFGWRGYALDRLQARWNALVSSLILGFVWGLWHLPLFFGASESIYYQGPIWGLLLSTTLQAILITWIYNNTGRSLFAVLLFHTTINFSFFLFPTLRSDQASLYYFVLLFTAVIAVVVIWGPSRLVREESTVESQLTLEPNETDRS